MNLKTYLEDNAISQTDFAKMIGGFQGDVSAWCRGAKEVPVARCKKIYELTDGQVSYKEMRPNDWQLYWSE